MAFLHVNDSSLQQIYREDPVRAARELRVALRRAGGCVKDAAKAMGMSKPGVWFYLRELKMNHVPAEIRDQLRYRKRLPPLSEFHAHVKRTA